MTYSLVYISEEAIMKRDPILTTNCHYSVLNPYLEMKF